MDSQLNPPIALSRNALTQLPEGVARPTFDPIDVRAGIVHLGLGSFHRAHMARYTHDLMNARPECRDWGIVGAGLVASDERMRDALEPQDALYTLVERQDEREVVTVIGSIRNVIFAGESSRSLLDIIDDAAIRIVSLTVTPHGYCLHAATRRLDFNNPAIVHDLRSPLTPRSAIGIIVEAYRRRMVTGQPAFTTLSCDNIQHNGAILRDAVLALADRRDSRLSAWIESRAGFPSTMVDRITPATTAVDIAHLSAHWGVSDRWPVFSELFKQWVIEDHFVQSRPPWENVGAQFVKDVEPYEFMKLRLLNASHLAVAGIGSLIGFKYIDEALSDDCIRAYMRALMDRETGPTLPPLPDIDLEAYKASLIQRFSNTKIKDTVDRVNNDASVTLLTDTIMDRLRAKGDFDLLALALAAWMRRVRGEDDAGQRYEVVHPLSELLRDRAIEGGSDPRPLLAITTLFGELIDSPKLVTTIGFWLTSLYARGAKATLASARQSVGF